MVILHKDDEMLSFYCKKVKKRGEATLNSSKWVSSKGGAKSMLGVAQQACYLESILFMELGVQKVKHCM